jgi:hypothetical protein
VTFVTNYFTSKRWEKVGCQELRSTPYKQEIDPRMSQTSKRKLDGKNLIQEQWVKDERKNYHQVMLAGDDNRQYFPNCFKSKFKDSYFTIYLKVIENKNVF